MQPGSQDWTITSTFDKNPLALRSAIGMWTLVS